jgi:hypothetical protein
MTQSRFLLALPLVLSLLAAVASPAQAQQASQITVTVRAGFDGYYEDALWIPVRVSLENTGPDVVGGRVVILAPRYDGSAVEYSRPVELPSGARKELFMYVIVEGYVSKLTVAYMDGSQTLGSNSSRVTQTSNTDLTYGVLAASPSTFNVLASVDPINGQARLAQLTVEDLPPAAQAWRALDVLVISDVDTGQFSDAQKNALRAWVSGGGRLIVVGGPNWQKVAPGLSDLLPLLPTRTQTVNALTPLGAYVSEAAPGGATILSTGALQVGSAALIAAEGQPLIAERVYGFGKVDMLTFDPALAPLKGWRGMEGVYRNLLAAPSDRPGWSGSYRNWYNAGEAVNAIPGIGLPHPLQICIFLGGYVFVVGPLNYLLLRRLKRRELAWLTIPAAVILFTTITYIAGFGLRGTRPTLHRLTVAQVWENSDRAQVETLIGIFSPRRDEYDLQVDGDLLLRPLPSDTYYRSVNLSLDGVSLEQADSVFVRHVRVDVGAITPFVAQGQVAAPRFSSKLTYTVKGSVATLEGAIQNLSNVTLKDAVILSAGGSQKIGDVIPGQTLETSVPLSASRATSIWQNATQVLPAGSPVTYVSSGYSNYDTTIDDIFGSTSYYDDRETYRRYSMLTWLFDPYSTGGRGSGTYLVGWTDDSPVQASLVGDRYNVSDKTFYIIRFEPEVVVSAGTITIPPGLMTWQLVDPGTVGGGSPYDSYVSQGYFTMRFKPAVIPDFKSIKSLTMHLTSYGASGSVPLAVSLWDQQEGNWVEVKALNWGDTPIRSPERFVGNDGRIDLRVESPSYQNSASIETLDFTLIVQR